MTDTALFVRPVSSPAARRDRPRCECLHRVEKQRGRCPNEATFRVVLRCLEAECTQEVHRSVLCDPCVEGWVRIAQSDGFADRLTITAL